MRELVMLGTASQVPTRTRNHNGYFLRWEREGIVQVVRALVSLATPGLDLRLHPHGAAGPIAPEVEVEPLLHRIEAYGYQVTEPDGRTFLPSRLESAGIWGPDVGRLQREGRVGTVRLEDVSAHLPGRRFGFVMDTAVCDGAYALADGADLLVAESTFSDDHAALATQYLHLTAGQARALAAAGGAGTLVLTHFSSRYDDVDLLAAQARATAGETPVIAASDLDRIPFVRRRQG